MSLSLDSWYNEPIGVCFSAFPGIPLSLRSWYNEHNTMILSGSTHPIVVERLVQSWSEPSLVEFCLKCFSTNQVMLCPAPIVPEALVHCKFTKVRGTQVIVKWNCHLQYTHCTNYVGTIELLSCHFMLLRIRSNTEMPSSFPLPCPPINSVPTPHSDDTEHSTTKQSSIKQYHITVVPQFALAQNLTTDWTSKHSAKASNEINEAVDTSICLETKDFCHSLF